MFPRPRRGCYSARYKTEFSDKECIKQRVARMKGHDVCIPWKDCVLKRKKDNTTRAPLPKRTETHFRNTRNATLHMASHKNTAVSFASLSLSLRILLRQFEADFFLIEMSSSTIVLSTFC